jgi:hypothetical protein
MLIKRAVAFWIGFAIYGLAIGLPTWWGFSQFHPPASHSPQAQGDKAAQRDPKEEADEKIADYTLALAVFTGVLTLATIGLMGATFFQLRLGRQEFIATHRPILRARRFYINRLTDGHPIKVEFEIANIGDSEAQGVIVHLQVKVPPRRGDVLYDRPEAPFSGIAHEFAFSSIPRGASRPFVMLTNLEHRAHDPRFKVENITISGVINYSDALNTPRATGFVRRYLEIDGAVVPRPPHRFVAPKKPDPDYDYED